MAKDKKVENSTLSNAKSIFSKVTDKLPSFIKLNSLSKENKNRVISALILIPLAIYAICFSVNLFLFISIILTIIMTSEWLELTKGADEKEKGKWHLIGLAYIAIPIFCVIKLRLISSDVLLWMFAVIWATDIFAFFSGKTFGGPKLAPTISPNKTWAGLGGGVFASMIIGFLSSFMFSGGIIFFVLFSAFLAVIEQVGDLIESKCKRIFDVKDSGSIIPGHGGILDRMDGIVLTAPVVLFFVTTFADKF